MSDVSKFASLKPAFFFHLDLEEPKSFVNNAKGTETVVMIKKGYAKSLSPEYPLDVEFDLGWDILRTTVDKPGVTTLDCDVFGKSKVNGAGIHLWYDGVVIMNEKAVAVIAGESDGFEVDEAYVTNHPSFQIGAEGEQESWANGTNFLGKGKFLRDAEGKLQIEYYVYALE
jgi:hypothetical protein